MKSNNLLFLHILTGTALLLVMAACEQEFLDVNPVALYTEAGYYASADNLTSAIAGVYNAFQQKENEDLFERFRLYLGCVASDEAEIGGDSPDAWPDGLNIDLIEVAPNNPVIRGIYGAMFNGISRSSYLIENVNIYKSENPGIDTTLINRRLGEAYFLRAACYFVLTRAFGGVPIVDHVLTPDEYDMPRATIKENYSMMEKDLGQAIQYLPEEGDWPSTQDIGRATKGAAQSLLAKIYVFESSYFSYYGADDPRMGAVENRWAEALALCEEVIVSDKYELVGIEGEKYSTFWTDDSAATNGFCYLFSLPGNNNKESVFAIQHTYDQFGYNISRGVSTNQFVGTRSLFLNDAQGNPTTTSSTVNSHCWGFLCPTTALKNKYDPKDPRLKTTIGQRGDSIKCRPDGNALDWYNINPFPSPTDMVCLKYEMGPDLPLDIGLYWQAGPQNMYYLRYADVVLLASEAAMMTDDQGKALQYINMVRARARKCGNDTVPVDLTGDILLQDIMDERMRELALEGHRFFDLVRWNKAEEILEPSQLEWNDEADVAYDEPRDAFFPLPETEVLKSKVLVQYAGW